MAEVASAPRAEGARTQILDGLEPAQRTAVEAVRGPVAILAGAGTGKTTTVTRRIAWQVASGAWSAREVLAVTFTDKAAGELRSRLATLGVRGVEARTFHGAALWMLSVLWTPCTGRPLPRVMPHKTVLLDPIVARLPMPDRFRPRREFAQEIEWAKNRRVTPASYLAELERTEHEPPVSDPARMQQVFARYEAAREAAGGWDFEDVLARCVDMFEQHPIAGERIRRRFRAITVDEYQDVNALQQALLDEWTKGGHDLCVVGDDYQTIYGFTGASPAWLLDFPDRHPGTTVVSLERSWRSTPEVLAMANHLADHMGGHRKQLRSSRPAGPAPVFRELATRSEEAAWVATECHGLHALGVPWQEMAVLYRINARSPEFEAALGDAGIPFVVTAGAFLDRPGPRGLLRAIARRGGGPVDVALHVRGAAERVGWSPAGAVRGGDEAQTLQEDLGRLVELAEASEFSDVAAYCDHVRELHAPRTAGGSGVQLMSLHRSKGLEFDAVFLPRLNDRELPFRSRTATADVADERRLLYVGITRARTHLALSRALDAGGPSQFLAELGLRSAGARPTERANRGRRNASAPIEVAPEHAPLVEALRHWRREESNQRGVPAYTVFADRTLAAIAAARPSSDDDLIAVSGVGPAKLDRHGAEVLAIVRATPRP